MICFHRTQESTQYTLLTHIGVLKVKPKFIVAYLLLQFQTKRVHSRQLQSHKFSPCLLQLTMYTTHFSASILFMRTKTELQICVYIYVVPTVRVPFCKTPLELSIFLIEASFKTGEKLLCIITFKTKTS